MYAIIQTGGKQYRVAEGDTLRVEKLTANQGDTIVLDKVLLVASDQGVKVGKPLVSGATVTAKVVGHDRAKKIIIFKFRRRKNYHRKQGHRQPLTTLQITGIKG